MAKSSERASTEKLLCSRCVCETNHALLSTYDTHWEVDEAGVDGGATHDFLKCNGCETATLRITSWFSEEPGETSETLYPPRRSREVVRTPKEFDEITYGGPLDSVYRQTVSAYNQKLLTLAGAGVRLIIEGVCNERGIKDGEVIKDGVARRKDNLEGRINGLAENGYISTQQATTLHQIRFLGNDAAHELNQPSAKNVSMSLDIVEHLLEQVYEQPAKAKALAARKLP